MLVYLHETTKQQKQHLNEDKINRLKWNMRNPGDRLKLENSERRLYGSQRVCERLK